MRVLFADDQIPDEDIPDHEIYDVVSGRYPKAQDGFVRAFPLMRRVVRSVAENNDVTVATRYEDALALARDEHFDVAIIDLGWYADKAVRQADRPVAGWKIAAAIDEADAEHPERPATAQIIYSARFGSNPELGQIAANKGKLPFFKPYREPFTIPLESEVQVEEAADEVASAIQSLRAAVSFVEHLSTSGRGQEQTLYRDLEVMRKSAGDALSRAIEREKRWDLMTRILVTLGVGIVLVGVLASLFLGVPEGAVTAASGVVVVLIPRLLYGQLEKTRREIQSAIRDLQTWVTEAERLRGGLVRDESPTS